MSERDFFGEVVFGVYQRGGNPDLVDMDRVATSRANGCDEDQAAAAELHYQRRGRTYRTEWDRPDGEHYEP